MKGVGRLPGSAGHRAGGPSDPSPASRSRRFARSSTGAGEDNLWRPIDTAPRDGTEIQAQIPGHGSDNVIAWTGGLRDSDDRDCDGWVFTRDGQEPPDSWTDGICWAVNEDNEPSVLPTRWKHLPKPSQEQKP